MKGYLKLILSISILFSANYSSAQIEEIEDISAFTFSIKSIDQFIDRFNYDQRDAFRSAYEQAKGTMTGSEREKAILTLFDFDRIENSEDPYGRLLEDFIRHVENKEKSIYLDFYDDEWYVKLVMDIKYKGQSHQLEATLHSYSSSENRSSWTIAAINCKDLNWHYSDLRPNILLPPNSEGTDFINFRHLIKAKSQHLAERKRDTAFEPFFQEVIAGNLTFSFITDIQYIFIQIPDYMMVVKEFRRKGENSGWLIDELALADDQQKANYIATELGIKN